MWVGKAPVPGLTFAGQEATHRNQFCPSPMAVLCSGIGPGAWLPVLYCLSPFVLRVFSGCFMWETGEEFESEERNFRSTLLLSSCVHTLPGRQLPWVVWFADLGQLRGSRVWLLLSLTFVLCVLWSSLQMGSLSAHMSASIFHKLLRHQCGRASASASLFILSHSIFCLFVCLNVHGFCVHLCLCIMYMPSGFRGCQVLLNLLELQRVVSLQVCAGNWTLILWKSSLC